MTTEENRAQGGTMRAKLRSAILAGGVGSVLVLVLMTAAAGSGSWAIASIAGLLGIMLVAGTAGVLLRYLGQVSASNDGMSTRIRKLEARSSDLDERTEFLKFRVDTATETIAAHRTQFSAGAATISAHEDRIVGHEKSLSDLSRNLETHSRHLEELADGVTSLRGASERSAMVVSQLGRELSRVDAKQKSASARLDRARKDLRVLRARVPSDFLVPVEADLRDLHSSVKTSMRTSFESALQLGRAPRDLITTGQAALLFREYLRREELLRLGPLIEHFNLLGEQSLTTLRRLYRFFRLAGYWELAATAVEAVHEKSKGENDARAVEKIRHEIALFSEPSSVTVDLPDALAYDPQGPILHMVGRVLPDTQTGYTLRTQYTALAQARHGLPVAIVGQAGITNRAVEQIEQYDHQGIDYFLLPGPARNEILLDDWLRLNMHGLAELVQQLRPSVLHAQSDFINALIVAAVGRKYGIPTVYESRGFWEESWLSRTITANQWGSNAETLFDVYGMPTAYSLRKRAEEVARLLPDHVFTLAEVMREHILDSANGEIAEDGVSIVPNAVEAESFPVQETDRELAEQIGLPRNSLVVGYISSIVEYEGIDTLIDGYHQAATQSGTPMCLLLVGDGDYLGALKQHVERRGIQDVYFTGRVPHGDVLRYYGLIDLFVVPRKKSQVADLVTPLKPFEAFSTGRCVILSDVRALQEIAEQSGAVETFRAGSADDLARKIEMLAKHPSLRREISQKAARWVRNHRSWDRNVNEYYRVYRKLGFGGPENLHLESRLALDERGVNTGELLEQLASAGLPALRGWFNTESADQTAESILRVGWRFGEFDPIPVAHIEDWARYGEEHRSLGFQLHAWRFMDPLIQAYDDTGVLTWLKEAVKIAVGWIRVHRDIDYEDDPMAWYDMSQSLRTPRLIALALRAARVSEMRYDAIILSESISRHLDELHMERAFNPNNNHGFYTAVSQVHAAKYAYMFPEAGVASQDGRARLARMVEKQFAPDGVHLEHSPEYHRMLLKSFELAIRDELIEDDQVKVRIERASHVLGWMIQPDGTLVQFGDTPEVKVVGCELKSIDRQTQYLLSDGVEGQRPVQELAAYQQGGYAFVRSPQPDAPGKLSESGYLAFNAAFHSRAHKHADDLNVVWYDLGQQILTDGGRFGYGELLDSDSPLRREGFYYADPERRYVEGTMAHNTLMVDGQNQDRRSRDPYGSGLGECAQSADGTFELSAQSHHVDYMHRRHLAYRPGESLRITDSITTSAPGSREGTLWFNVSGHFELEESPGEVVFVSTATQTVRLVIQGPGRLLPPVRGQKEPLRGWRSRLDRTLEPAWSVGFTFSVDKSESVETLLRLVRG